MAFCALLAGIDHRQFDIAHGVQTIQQMELLEHETELAIAHGGQRIRVHGGHGFAVEPVGAGGRPVETADHIHEGRFAGAGRPHHRDEFAEIDLQIDIKQRMHGLIAEMIEAREFLDFDERAYDL